MNCRLLEGLSIRLSKELSKGLSETAANIYKMIYAGHCRQGNGDTSDCLEGRTW